MWGSRHLGDPDATIDDEEVLHIVAASPLIHHGTVRVQAHPRCAQQVARIVQHGARQDMFFTPAVANISDARAMPCSIMRRVFSLIA